MRINEYPLEVYDLFEKAISGDRKAFRELKDGKYPEWAAFANAILGDKDAVMWLINNKFALLGILANAMDDEANALIWLRTYVNPLPYCFCQATKGDENALLWLKQNNFKPLYYLSFSIKKAIEYKLKEEIFWYRVKW